MTAPLRLLASPLNGKARPATRPATLGQTVPAAAGEWNAYLSALGGRLASARQGSIAAFRTLRAVRQGAGLPPGPANAAERSGGGGITPEFERDVVEAAALAAEAERFLAEAVAGTRKVSAGPDGLAIESLPGDANRIVLDAGRPRLVDAQTGAPVAVTGTVGIAWVPLVLAGVAVVAAAVYAIVKMNETAQAVSQDRTTRTLSQHQQDCVASGKSPAECAGLTTGLVAATADLQRARGESAKSSTEGITSTVKTVAVVGALVALLYFGAQVIPAFAPRRAAAA